MSNQNFEKAIAFVLDSEKYGGKAEKGDAGHRTIWGLAERWHPEAVAEMAAMSPEDAKLYAEQVYMHDYWKPAGCETLPWPRCLVVMDAAVQHDVGDAVKLNRSCSTWQEIIEKRRTKYRALAQNPEKARFLKGWLDRMDRLEKAASA